MGLKDKAAKLDFSGLPMVGTSQTVRTTHTPEGGPRPKTAPGAMMAFANDARSELLMENEELRARALKADELQGNLNDALNDLQQWNDAKATRLLDPERIVRSQFANRHALNFSGFEFEQLKAEIRDAGGNVQPIKVRPLASSDGVVTYEIVFGHRRHEACRQLGLAVLAVVDNLDDRALFVEMDRENRARKDLSAWEQGVTYRRALDKKLYPSNRKLAEAVGVDLGAVGKALALAALPDEVVSAFASPLHIQFRWAKPLSDALSADRNGVLARARELKNQPRKIGARQVFERLIALDEKGVEPFNPLTPIQIEIAGKRAATVTIAAKGGATVTIEPAHINPENAQLLADFITEFLAQKKLK